MTDDLLTTVKKALAEHPERTNATCMEDVYRTWLCALLARCEAAEAEVERLNSPVLKSDWQQMVAERDAARAEAAQLVKLFNVDTAELREQRYAALQQRDAARAEVERKDAILRQLVKDGRLWIDLKDLQAARVRVAYQPEHESEVVKARADDVALVARLSHQVVALRDAITRVLDGPHYIDRDYQDVLLAALDTPEREGGRGDDSDCV